MSNLERAKLADRVRCLEAINWLYEMLGLEIDPDRNAILAKNMEGLYTVSHLRMILDQMKLDPDLADKAHRRGGLLTLGDFERFARPVSQAKKAVPMGARDAAKLAQALGITMDAFDCCGFDDFNNKLYVLKKEVVEKL